MSGELVAALGNLSQDDPGGNVSRIKLAVVSQLRQADESAEIKTTDYFNHTFAPDIIMRWRDSGSAERRVYLRPDVRSASLTEDLQWIGDLHPLIVPLASDASESPDERTDLDVAAASSNTLIAGAKTLDEIVESNAGRTGRLMRKAIVRGARGVVTPERVKQAADRVEDAFDAAQVSEEAPVRSAVDAVEDLLDLGHSAQVARFLQAVWVASGSAASTFPGATGVTGALDSESLQLLLQTEDLDDAEFWARVAKNVTIFKLCDLEIANSNESFQILVNNAADRVRAKGLVALAPTVGRTPGLGARWSAANGLLHYSSDTFHAIIPPAALSAAVFSGDAVPGEGIAVSSVFNRLTEQASVSGLSFQGRSSSALHWEADAPIRTNTDELLNAVTSSIGSAAPVTSLRLRLAGDRDMSVNFLTGRVSGRTNASFYISELLDAGLAMLISLAEADRRSINEVISGVAITTAGD